MGQSRTAVILQRTQLRTIDRSHQITRAARSIAAGGIADQVESRDEVSHTVGADPSRSYFIVRDDAVGEGISSLAFYSCRDSTSRTPKSGARSVEASSDARGIEGD